MAARLVLGLGIASSIALQPLFPSLAADVVLPAAADAEQTIAADAAPISAGEQLAQAESPDNPIDALTKRILSKEIELERLNAYYRVKSTRQDRFRTWRTWAFAQQNAWLTGSGLYTGVIERLQNIQNNPRYTSVKLTSGPDKGKRRVEKQYVKLGHVRVENSLTPQMIGQIINSADDGLELILNQWYDYQTHREGFGPKTARLLATKLEGEIDQMMDQREKLIGQANFSPKETEILTVEGKVLKDMRDLSVKEFSDFWVGGKRLRTNQNVAFGMNFAKNTTGWLGVMLGEISQYRSQPKITGGNGVLTMISGCLIPLVPISGKYVGDLHASLARRSVQHYVGVPQVTDPAVFDADRLKLEGLLSDTSVLGIAAAKNAQNKQEVYRAEGRILFAQKALAASEKKAAKSAFVQSVAVAGIVGGTKISLGVANQVIAWGKIHNSRMLDQLSLAGQLSYGTGSYIGALDGIRVRAQGVMKAHDQRRAGTSAGQVINQRLADLDSMGRIVNVSGPLTSEAPQPKPI
jgi:hypothetical protein